MLPSLAHLLYEKKYFLFKSSIASSERAKFHTAKTCGMSVSGICNKHECAPFLARLKGPFNKRRDALKKIKKVFSGEKNQYNESMKHTFKTHGTCSLQITFDKDDDGKIHNVEFEGGCNGNLKALSKLVEGMEAQKIYDVLHGNTCRSRPTSCADQLAQAVMEE